MGNFTQTTIAEGDIFAGLHGPVSYDDVTLASPVAYKRGDAIAYNTSTTKHQGYDPDGSNGTNTLKGILVDDVDATLADGKGSIYVHGEFAKGMIHDIDDTDVDAGVYNSGTIVIKEVN